jgi:hypothetical protein
LRQRGAGWNALPPPPGRMDGRRARRDRGWCAPPASRGAEGSRPAARPPRDAIPGRARLRWFCERPLSDRVGAQRGGTVGRPCHPVSLGPPLRLTTAADACRGSHGWFSAAATEREPWGAGGSGGAGHGRATVLQQNRSARGWRRGRYSMRPGTLLHLDSAVRGGAAVPAPSVTLASGAAGGPLGCRVGTRWSRESSSTVTAQCNDSIRHGVRGV